MWDSLADAQNTDFTKVDIKPPSSSTSEVKSEERFFGDGELKRSAEAQPRSRVYVKRSILHPVAYPMYRTWDR